MTEAQGMSTFPASDGWHKYPVSPFISDYMGSHPAVRALAHEGGAVDVRGPDSHRVREFGFGPTLFEEAPGAYPEFMVTALGSAFSLPYSLSDASDLVARRGTGRSARGLPWVGKTVAQSRTFAGVIAQAPSGKARLAWGDESPRSVLAGAGARLGLGRLAKSLGRIPHLRLRRVDDLLPRGKLRAEFSIAATWVFPRAATVLPGKCVALRTPRPLRRDRRSPFCLRHS